MRPFFLFVLCFSALSVSVSGDDPAQPNPHEATVPIYRAGHWQGYDRQFQTHIDGVKKELARKDAEIIWIGDSITNDWYKGGRKVWEKYYAPRKAVNMGLSGDRTQNVLYRLEMLKTEMAEVKPKVVIVMIGVNNIIAQYQGLSTPENTANGIKAIAEVLHKYYPDATVLLLHTLPTGEKPENADRKKIDEINGYLPKLFAEDKKTVLLNTNDVFLKDGVIPRELMGDFVHPTEAGYEAWAKAVEPVLSKLLGSKPIE
ncbi:MAG: GDSL-type esterase/lipase family protein [Planctomycetaceae bacterium]|nr:GDSL-type esterase/lipase family protein [Planctomycetaceae bacterium]